MPAVRTNTSPAPVKAPGWDKKPLDSFEISDKKYSFEDLAPLSAENLPGPSAWGSRARREENLPAGRRLKWMPGVRVKPNEPFEVALKRFKKQCEKAGILSEIRKREHYEKPSIKRKKKILAAKKRALKKLRKIEGS